VQKNNMADKKNLVEEALLQMENLQEAITNNAKGILASTMKEEISELVKESLGEEEVEKVSEMETEENVEMSEQEEIDVEDVEVDDAEDDIEDALEDLGLDMGGDMESDNDEELDLGDEEMLMTDLPGDDLEVDDEEEVLLPLDLTAASDDEVLKVFKAMGEEDGIIVKQDGDDVHLADTETDSEYVIQLGESEEEEEVAESMGDHLGEDETEEDVVYEIEIGEEDAHEDEMSEGDYGGNKGDESRSHRDYEANEGKHGGNKGDESRSHRDYEANEGKYGGNKGDESRSHRDYESNEGKYGGNKGDESRSHRDYESNEGETAETARSNASLRKYPNAKSASEEVRTYAKGRLRPAVRENKELKTEVQQLREKNEEYRKALNVFKTKLNEVAVFNSNLAYATRLFTEHSTTKQEKINILRRFDGVETLKESKSLYKTVKEDLGGKEADVVTESVQSKVSKTPSKGSANNLIESKTYENPQFLRMRDLMSKLK
jgi:hypothetical protein